MTWPIEPPPCVWQLPAAETAEEDLVAVGADLEPGTLLNAYRRGLFPMEVPNGQLGWWSPCERGVLPLDGLHVSKSLRRSTRRFSVTVDTAFEDVVDGCADPKRPHGWINESFRAAYVELYRLGWAHSVETWDGDELVGGLYGVSIGGMFAGESMFSNATDASKVALVHLVGLLCADNDARRLLDVQWRTDHLASLGVVGVPRLQYLGLLLNALQAPLPLAFQAPRS